ncbi:MAG: hypothetical protein CMK32_03290 [Porticoccaceae bacterium]|nr:hypothetical protein [Porticoccaceae bacterium]
MYDRIVYEEADHIPLGRLATDILCVTFNGLSKAYRLAGFRSGWLVVSGAKHRARGYIQGMEMLCSMRLCANVPAMYAIQTALGGYQSINDLIRPGGRLYEQRELAYNMITAIPGVTCVKPRGALYMFPRLDPDMYAIEDDEQLALDLLLQEKMLLVQGSAFNFPDNNHFRIVFLPREDDLGDAVHRLGRFLDTIRKR